MGLIRDKIAGNARESVENAEYRSTGATGFDAMPSVPSGDRSANVRAFEQYDRGNVPGVNIHTGRKGK